MITQTPVTANTTQSLIALAAEEQRTRHRMHRHIQSCDVCRYDSENCETAEALRQQHLTAFGDWDYALSAWLQRKPISIQYGKYLIVEKLDFGNECYFIDGVNVDHGYVVVLDGCNAMPGATWFQTVREAKLACDILDSAGPDKFWARWELLRETNQRVARRDPATEQHDRAWLDDALTAEKQIRDKSVRALCNGKDIEQMRYLLRIALGKLESQGAKDEHHNEEGALGLFTQSGWCIGGIVFRPRTTRLAPAKFGLIVFNVFIGVWQDEHPEDAKRWSRQWKTNAGLAIEAAIFISVAIIALILRGG